MSSSAGGGARDLALRITRPPVREMKAATPPSDDSGADASTERVARLDSNENRFGASAKALEAATRSLSSANEYPDPHARALREAIARMTDASPDEVVCASGSDGVTQLITRAFFSEGDELLTVSATFVGPLKAARLAGLHVRKVPLSEGYEYDLARVGEAVTDRTRVIYLANPNNPTGTYFTDDAFRALMERVPAEVLVVVDEAYAEFAASLAPGYREVFSHRYPNVIVLRTFSKAYGLAGLRVGYALGPRELIEPMATAKLKFDPSGPAQAAALAALEDDEFVQEAVRRTARGRERMYRIFESYGLEHVPSWTNFVLVPFNREEEAVHCTDELARRGVRVRRLPMFGLPSCVRITVGSDPELEQLDRSLSEIYS